MNDKIYFWLTAAAGVGMWFLIAYAVIETLSNPTPFN